MKSSLGNHIADMVLRDYITNGIVRPGERLPTILELKREYCTSDTTIQRALTILELRGVVDKRHGSGCYVSEADNAEAAPKLAKMIGYVLSFQDIGSSETIERVCSKHDYSLVVAYTQDDYDTEQAQVKRLIGIGCKAIIVYPAPRTQKQLRQDYLKSEHRDFPIVLLDTGYPEQQRPMVVFDNYLAGYHMTRFLISEGHRRIAFMDYDHVDDEMLISPVKERYRGFLDALDSAGIRFDPKDTWRISGLPSNRHGNDIWEPAYRRSHKDMENYLTPILANWREQHEHPTALIAIEDSYTCHAIRLARKLGIAVPGELCVAGFDNRPTDDSPFAHFPTTTPDAIRAAQIATEMAISYAKGELPIAYAYVLPATIRQGLYNEFESKTDLGSEDLRAGWGLSCQRKM